MLHFPTMAMNLLRLKGFWHSSQAKSLLDVLLLVTKLSTIELLRASE